MLSAVSDFHQNAQVFPPADSRRWRKLVTRLLNWFDQSARGLPWRRAEDPYAIWISEIMLQQTRVATVIPYWRRWMKAMPNVSALARARPQQVLKLWEGLGYYTRARNAQQAARIIVKKFGGKFPSAFADVLALPGIGPYTAGAICSIAFNQPRPVLDANVARVLGRIFATGPSPREKPARAALWQLAGRIVNSAAGAGPKGCSRINQALMELGALLCLPRQPACALCPAVKLCAAHRTGQVQQLPALAPRPARARRRFLAFIVQNKNRFLAKQRPSGVVNADLWEFPNVEIAFEEKNLAAAALPFALRDKRPQLRLRHSITRYDIHLEAYRARAAGHAIKSLNLGVWLTAAQIRRLPFTAAHRRISQTLQGLFGPG
jgi:A/G-specific adenine glycosylase